jgi:hypothetical protein
MSLSIRLSTASDTAVLSRLAALDDAAPPSGRALIAERDGVAVAAVTLTSGRVLGGSAPRIAGAVHLLRLRRYRLLRQGGRVARLSSLSSAPALSGVPA